MAISDNPGQLNFAVNHSGQVEYENWCASEGYDKKMVFYAGWRVLQSLKRDDRKPFFDGFPEWEQGADAEAVGRIGPDSVIVE